MTCALILAAGLARRMGTPKLLLPLGGKPVIASVVDAFLDAAIDQVLVVTRPGDALLRAALVQRPVCWVENPETAGELLGSVRCGLRALPPGVETLLCTPADLPGLTAPLVAGLLGAYRWGGKGLAVPHFAGRRGHPLVFAARYCGEVLTRFDGIGLRGLLEAHPEEVLDWLVPGAAAMDDLDTPEDYARWQRRQTD